MGHDPGYPTDSPDATLSDEQVIGRLKGVTVYFSDDADKVRILQILALFPGISAFSFPPSLREVRDVYCELARVMRIDFDPEEPLAVFRLVREVLAKVRAEAQRR